ncbi:hypothetical protein HELRODRAFT_178147 [Helobdella robusta]|uniref:Uncharacterized protein n=1 Tax=Helobdella robusta TaxID=6412 RepID=T1FCU3_HELRO|nr:hypothetical protein HELRODRAFT_178147 [Helobdella robusta]ESN97360.1 hypothetical protein HELRODRAFT_178147 [Helobdella robusta]
MYFKINIGTSDDNKMMDKNIQAKYRWLKCHRTKRHVKQGRHYMRQYQPDIRRDGTNRTSDERFTADNRQYMPDIRRDDIRRDSSRQITDETVHARHHVRLYMPDIIWQVVGRHHVRLYLAETGGNGGLLLPSMDLHVVIFAGFSGTAGLFLPAFDDRVTCLESCGRCDVGGLVVIEALAIVGNAL